MRAPRIADRDTVVIHSQQLVVGDPAHLWEAGPAPSPIRVPRQAAVLSTGSGSGAFSVYIADSTLVINNAPRQLNPTKRADIQSLGTRIASDSGWIAFVDRACIPGDPGEHALVFDCPNGEYSVWIEENLVTTSSRRYLLCFGPEPRTFLGPAPAANPASTAFAYSLFACDFGVRLGNEHGLDRIDEWSPREILASLMEAEESAMNAKGLWLWKWGRHMFRVAPVQLAKSWNPIPACRQCLREAGVDAIEARADGAIGTLQAKRIAELDLKALDYQQFLDQAQGQQVDVQRAFEVLYNTLFMAKRHKTGLLWILSPDWDYDRDPFQQRDLQKRLVDDYHALRSRGFLFGNRKSKRLCRKPATLHPPGAAV